MNTVTKFLTGTAVIALLPLGAMAATDDTIRETDPLAPVVKEEASPSSLDAEVRTGDTQVKPAIEAETEMQGEYQNSAGPLVEPEDAGETALATNPFAPEKIEIEERSMDAFLADASLVDDVLENSLVVSSDNKLVGNVQEVYQKPSGQLMAKIILDETVEVETQYALVPVNRLDDGNLQMDGDFDAIQQGFIEKVGSKQVRSNL